MKTLPDIYYSSSYGRLYEEVERAECVKFEYSDVNGSVLNMFMKRPIPWLIDGVQYYDIVTPYGYGGPVVMHAENREALLQNYWTAWNTYCMENRIVCEFVRFHPLIANHLDFMQRYDAKKIVILLRLN